MIGMSIKRISVLNLCHVLKPFVKSTPGRCLKHLEKKKTRKKNEYISYHYHFRPPTPRSSVPSFTDTSRAPTKASRTTSREREFSQGTVCIEQNRAIPGVGGGGGGIDDEKYDEMNR